MVQAVQSDLVVTGLNTLYWKGTKLENVSSFNIFVHKNISTCTIVVSCEFSNVILSEIKAAGINIRKGVRK